MQIFMEESLGERSRKIFPKETLKRVMNQKYDA